jgi:hypothetical protein
LYTTEPLVWWDNLKYKIKKISQIFSENLAKEKRKAYSSFDKRELFRTHIPGPLSILHKLKFIITKV